MIRFARNLPLAVLLMAGIMAFSYGASRMISSPISKIAHAIKERSNQVTEVGP